MNEIANDEKLYFRAIFSVSEELFSIKELFKFTDVRGPSLLLDLILEYIFTGNVQLNSNSISVFTPHLSGKDLEELIPELKVCIDQIFDKITALSPDTVPLKNKIYHVYEGGIVVLVYLPYNESIHSNVNRSTLLSEKAINYSIRAHSRCV